MTFFYKMDTNRNLSQQGRLTSLAKRWASLTLSTSIITSSSCVGNSGSFFPIKVSIRWKSSTSYLGEQNTRSQHTNLIPTYSVQAWSETLQDWWGKWIDDSSTIKDIIRCAVKSGLIERQNLLSDKGDGLPRPSRSGSSSNPMDVVLMEQDVL